jgi:hypothetical protein
MMLTLLLGSEKATRYAEDLPPVWHWVFKIVAMPIIVLGYVAYSPIGRVIGWIFDLFWSKPFKSLRLWLTLVYIGLFRFIKWCGGPIIAVLLAHYWNSPPFVLEVKAAISTFLAYFLAHPSFRLEIMLTAILVYVGLGEYSVS